MVSGIIWVQNVDWDSLERGSTASPGVLPSAWTEHPGPASYIRTLNATNRRDPDGVLCKDDLNDP
jgi:hypothetical protein